MTRRSTRPALIAFALLAAQPALSAPIVAWTYIVRPGDTIATVAARMGVSPGDLARANAIGLDTPLVPGTAIKRPDPSGMPGSSGRPASSGTPANNARPPRRAPVPPRAAPVVRPALPDRVQPEAAQPEPMPELAPAHRHYANMPHLIWPTSGALVTKFGAPVRGLPDNGIDLAAFTGMTVHAAAAGKVIFAGTEPERFGQLVVIDHGGGWATAYAYLGKVLVHSGDRVTGGSVIARIGATGEVKKPTLHFELRHANVPQNPMPALPIRL